LFVIAGPKEQFSPNEISDLKKLIESGGRLLVLANEGGDRKYPPFIILETQPTSTPSPNPTASP